MKVQTYHCVCPVCEKLHSIKAEFVSGDVKWMQTENRYRVIRSCGDHTAAELTEAYQGKGGQ